MENIRAVVSTEFEAVNRHIIEQLHSQVPLVENIGHYIIEAGGKRLRPLLALLSGGACGNLNEHHITLAAVIEFIHTATLLHDDVVDISTLRRGRPTANAAWDNASSVLVGDFLYSRAFQMLVQLNNMPVMSLMANVTNTIAEGEVLQLTKAGDPETSEDDYFRVITTKTAVLFAAATASGGILAGATGHQVDLLHQFGLELGIAFQLIDDALDYEGDVSTMGKNVGDDLAEGKPTLPLIYAMQNADENDRQLVRRAISEKNGAAIDSILKIVTRSGAIEYTHAIAAEHAEKAMVLINNIVESPYRQALTEIIHAAIHRQS